MIYLESIVLEGYCTKIWLRFEEKGFSRNWFIEGRELENTPSSLTRMLNTQTKELGTILYKQKSRIHYVQFLTLIFAEIWDDYLLYCAHPISIGYCRVPNHLFWRWNQFT